MTLYQIQIVKKVYPKYDVNFKLFLSLNFILQILWPEYCEYFTKCTMCKILTLFDKYLLKAMSGYIHRNSRIIAG